jgi:uncharacterized protein CbrC (UPF0167 family)
MSQTFTELGIPFPLFEAPVDDASEYCGVGACSLCGAAGRHCFELGIGCAVMCACPSCGTENGLDADDWAAVACRQCEANVPFPALGKGEIRVCYECLRAGKAAIAKGTELGMISSDQAFEGVTNGIPGLDRDDFEMVSQGDDWVAVRLPQAIMWELLRTPTYSTIQDDCWQFCCRQPMVFLGQWSRKQFSRRAPDGDGRRLFDAIVQEPIKGLWEDELHDETGIYAFRCNSCGRLTAHWDLA